MSLRKRSQRALGLALQGIQEGRRL